MTEPSSLDAGPGAALDPGQLMRIEATHRGYGYQHLYAVACLLTMDESSTERLVIEYDEDIEVVRAASRVYVQVKTRDRPLRFSDLHGVLPRFAALRQEHTKGRRSGAARFTIVSNTRPGPELRARMEQPTWPADVVLLWPERPDVEADLKIPTPWPDISAALHACIAKAALIPFPSLTPETLVFKLAGMVQYLATGRAGHAVTRAQVRDFFEQLVIELHDFPEPPPNYRPQTEQPDLETRDRVQLVTGVSGSGKTAWASHAAVLHHSPLAYFDIGELPGSALATSLARELTARFLDRSTAGAGSATMPAGSGLELLALLSSRLHEAGLNVIVVLDNAHRVSATALRSVVEAAANLRFVLLSQPWPGQAEIEAHLGIQAQALGGWSSDTVAAAFAAAGCPLTAGNVQRVLNLTEGAPLYVNNAAHLAAQSYSGDVDRFLNAVEQRLAVVSTAQEVILSETFKQLTPTARKAAALLDLSDVPLEHDEALELISAGAIPPHRLLQRSGNSPELASFACSKGAASSCTMPSDCSRVTAVQHYHRRSWTWGGRRSRWRCSVRFPQTTPRSRRRARAHRTDPGNGPVPAPTRPPAPPPRRQRRSRRLVASRHRERRHRPVWPRPCAACRGSGAREIPRRCRGPVSPAQKRLLEGSVRNGE